MSSNSEEPIRIVPYDITWPGRFEEERNLLLNAIGNWILGTVEHIGSTAVPGLAAKPIIDIMAGVASLKSSRPAVAVLRKSGYRYYPYRPNSMHWLCKPSAVFRTHHLHLVPYRTR